MIRVAIVEDSEADAQALSRLLEIWRGENGAETLSCAVYSDAVKFLEQGSAAVDIVFMDIEMPYMNGMDAAAEFRKINRDAILIFATRATKYAVRGYSVDAIGYLVKPVGEDAFRAAFEKAVHLHRARVWQHTVMLKTKDGVVKLNTERIKYIEAVSHMLWVHAEDQVHKVWSGMDKMMEVLPDGFVSCHRGYIVNLKYVDCVKKDILQIVGEPHLQIPISRQKRGEFMQELTKYYAQTMRG